MWEIGSVKHHYKCDEICSFYSNGISDGDIAKGRTHGRSHNWDRFCCLHMRSIEWQAYPVEGGLSIIDRREEHDNVHILSAD